MSDRHHIEKILDISPKSGVPPQESPSHPYQRVYLENHHRDERCLPSPPPKLYSAGIPPYAYPSVCCSRVPRSYCSSCTQPPLPWAPPCMSPRQSSDGRINLHCSDWMCSGRRERDFSPHRNRSPVTKLRLQASHQHAVGSSHSRKHKRHRTAFTPTQLLGLENAFERNHYLVGEERKQLAVFLNLSETQIKVWFQNRRTKTKRQRLQEFEDEESGELCNDEETYHHHREFVLHPRQRDISEHELIEYERRLGIGRWTPA